LKTVAYGSRNIIVDDLTLSTLPLELNFSWELGCPIQAVTDVSGVHQNKWPTGSKSHRLLQPDFPLKINSFRLGKSRFPIENRMCTIRSSRMDTQ
jgi:hypothetical protein